MESGSLYRESENYGYFQRYVIEDLLGFDDAKHSSENVDFVVDNHSLVVECKGMKTGLDEKQYRKNESHGTPMNQLWDYMRHGEWGIVTNYRLFRIVRRSIGAERVYEIDFTTLYDYDMGRYELNHQKIKEFVYVFGEIIRSNAETLDVDYADMEDMEMTNRFYRLFSETRTMIAKEFSECGEPEATGKAQTFLNRLIFLFFVEDKDMVRNGLFMNHLKSSLTDGFPDTDTDVVCGNIRDNLFRVLDKGWESGSRRRIPRFNGGLFSDDDIGGLSFKDCRDETWFAGYYKTKPSSYQAGKISRDNPLLSPIILNMVEMRQYSFQSEIDINILGHVFEQSIQDIDSGGSMRKDEGIYYTPSYITDYICRNTIIPYLALSPKAQTPEDIVREYAEQDRLSELQKRLRDLRILDPACGSGAFITGAALVLFEFHKAIHDTHMLSRAYLSESGQAKLDEWNADSVMRSIISDNLYGVDKNPQSVKIAQLSLFLLVASPENPLPDTTKHIIAGNSIIRDESISQNAIKWDERFPHKFDIIIGNPPYGAKLSSAETKHIKSEFNIGGTNTAAVFIHQSLRLLKDGGTHGFIVPKSLMFSSREWTKTRTALIDDMVSLVDVGKVWKDVKLEQCIYILHHKSHRRDYVGLVRRGNDIVSVATIEKTALELFGVFPSAASDSEMNLGLKMKRFPMLGEYTENRRGASLLKYKTEKGDMAVVGGKEIQQYFVNGTRFHIDASKVQDDKTYVSDRSVLVQNIVAHISNPIDHIRIIATVPPTSHDFLIEETVNQLVVVENISPLFVLGLLHSRAVNWYLYRFIISKSVRTIHFDPPTTNRIPVNLSCEDEVVACVKKLLNTQGGDSEATVALDRLFYRIFGFDNKEIEMVEKSFPDRP